MENPNESLPAWLLRNEKYAPEKDREGYLQRSLLRMAGMLARLREYAGSASFRGSAALRLFFCVSVTAMVSASGNFVFTMGILALVLVRTVLLPAKRMVRVFLPALAAAAFTVLLLLPAVALGSRGPVLAIPVKVFVSVELVGLFATGVPWNRITEGLRAFHVPATMIFVLEMTLKYITVLGIMAEGMLHAVSFRSVGRNRTKRTAFSGILGTLFLRSRELGEQTYQAMVLRGYDGEYRRLKRRRFVREDVPAVLALAAVLAFFVYTEWVVRHG